MWKTAYIGVHGFVGKKTVCVGVHGFWVRVGVGVGLRDRLLWSLLRFCNVDL